MTVMMRVRGLFKRRSSSKENRVFVSSFPEKEEMWNVYLVIVDFSIWMQV